jgi:hypothetical protein
MTTTFATAIIITTSRSTEELFFSRKSEFLKDLAILLAVLLFSFFQTKAIGQSARVAPVIIPTGGFNIDGSLKVSSTAGDWVQGTSGTGGYVLKLAGAPPLWQPVDPATTKFIKDDYNSSSDLVFSGSAFAENPNAWKWSATKATNKCDINNALYHVTASSTSKWIILGGDRYNTTGTSYIDCEFLQGTLTRNTAATNPANPNGFTSVSATGSSLSATGGRTEGDFVLSMEYSNGGGNATVHYYRWEIPVGATAYKYVEHSIPVVSGDSAAFARTNAGTPDVPFGAFGLTTYQQFAFVEAAVNIDAILGGTCSGTGLNIKTLFIKTKASDSYSAALKDFVDPLPVSFHFGTESLHYDKPSFCKSEAAASPTASGTGTFTSSPGGLVFSDNANPSSTGIINLAASAAGDYTITYTFSSGGGCTGQQTADVSIYDNPDITAPAIGAICFGTTNASLSYGSVTNGADKYKIVWTSGLTSMSDFATLPTSPITISGTGSLAGNTYSGTLYIKNSTTGCESAGSSISLTVNAKPILTPGSYGPYCIDAAAATLGGSPAGGTWSGTGISLVGSVYKFTPATAGANTHTLTYNYTDGNSCSNTATTNVVVNAKPTLTPGSYGPYCIDAAAVTLGGSPAGGTWSGTGVSLLGSVYKFTQATAGANTHTLTYNYTDGNSCSNTATTNVVVNALPDVPNLTVVQPTCSNSNGSVTVNSPVDGGGIDYEYSKNNGTSWQEEVTFSIPSDASYSIVVRRKSSGCTATTSGTMGHSTSTPAASVTILTSPGCSSSTGTLKIVKAAGGDYDNTIFQFSNNGTDFGSNPVFSFVAGGGYNITVRRIADHTCSVTATCAGETQEIVNNTSQTQSANRMRTDATVNEASQTSVAAYPNPFNDKVRFEITSAIAGKGSLEVYNMLGQKIKSVYQGQIIAGNQIFELSLPSAQRSNLIYVLRVGDKRVTGKLLHLNR